MSHLLIIVALWVLLVMSVIAGIMLILWMARTFLRITLADVAEAASRRASTASDRPAWSPYEGALSEAVLLAEKAVDVGHPNSAHLRFTMALRHAGELYEGYEGHPPDRQAVVMLAEGIRCVHATLKAAGALQRVYFAADVQADPSEGPPEPFIGPGMSDRQHAEAPLAAAE